MEQYFSGYAEARRLFEILLTLTNPLGPYEIKVGKSQVALRRARNFCLAWIPEKALHRPAAPLVLTISFPQLDPSPRWKEIVPISRRRFTHHLEVYAEADLDAQVSGWLQAAYAAAG